MEATKCAVGRRGVCYVIAKSALTQNGPCLLSGRHGVEAVSVGISLW